MYFARAPPGDGAAPRPRARKAGRAGARAWAPGHGHGWAHAYRSYPSLVIRRNDLDVLDYIYLSFEFENSSNYSEFSPILDAAAADRARATS